MIRNGVVIVVVVRVTMPVIGGGVVVLFQSQMKRYVDPIGGEKSRQDRTEEPPAERHSCGGF
jgi:hypothetical protein